MSLLTKFFGSQKVDQRKGHFGRFSDSYKTKDKYNAWDESLILFEKKQYDQAYIKFFEYLRDDEQDNIKVWSNGNGLEFEMLQGSKMIKGIANEHIFRASSKIATTSGVNIGFLRRLIEHNYRLKYGRYCLDQDDDIAIVFDSFSIDASPYKLYYALKEISLAADKQDDLLIDEFEELTEVNTGHTASIPEEEKNIKYQYLQEVLSSIFDEIENGKTDVARYPGGVNYMYLDAAYKIDYLVRPEGYIMEVLERINRRYFATDKKSPAQKNVILKKEFLTIQQRPEKELKSELYQTFFTFGVTVPSNHDVLKNLIIGEVKNMDWYIENGHIEVALSIAGYIVGFSLFNYAIPKPDRLFLDLYYQIFESSFFSAMGQSKSFIGDDGQLNKSEIIRAIQSIKDQFKKEYPLLKTASKKLDFSRKDKFAKSYLLMIANFNLSKK